MKKTKLNFTESKPDIPLNKIVISRIRQAMELNVIAYNCFLKKQVNEMSYLTLLRNMHPLDRSFFARRLYSEHKLSKGGLMEFSNID